MSVRFLLLILFLILLGSCKQDEKTENKVADNNATYFSIKQFVKDQYDIYRGQPFGLVKTVRLNGKVDSSLVTANNMEWGSIFKIFFDTDISDPKFLNEYDFTMFEDDASLTRNFYYEAKSDKLYTKKLQISADVTTNKIRSIFIEASENTRWHGKLRKLFYMPLKVINIQEFERSTPGPDKELIIEYRFL